MLQGNEVPCFNQLTNKCLTYCDEEIIFIMTTVITEN